MRTSCRRGQRVRVRLERPDDPPAIDRVRGVVRPEPTFRDRHREGSLFAFRQLRRVATAPGPKFVFAHILLPHDPYVFKADGSPLSEEEADGTPNSSTPITSRMRTRRSRRSSGICSPPRGRPDRSIIEGDEGPLMCQSVDCVSDTPEYLRIRLGNLVAMYLPGVDVVIPDTFIVGTFRVVCANTSAQLEPLPDLHVARQRSHLRLQDVTDQILASSE